ncbi:MAG: NADH-quinone oxidoreductase subunit NuoH [Planctomycetota bacterium]|nr:NADH-quinone oxidoreductase subunit NuoH [Planctomycetota bacterium]
MQTPLVDFLTSVGLTDPLAHVIRALVPCVLIIHLVAVGALVFIWLERKVSGRIQDRLGPTRVGGRFGWLQTLADGIKLIAKEDITPGEADAMLFRIAPYVSFAASFAAWLAMPFAVGWSGLDMNVAVFFVLAVLGLEVFGVILAGYASGSKWSLFGAMREAAQVVSYEVPLGLCVVIPVFICGTMNLTTIGEMQRGLFTNWLIFHDPFTFCVFWVYFTCGVASVNRAPFDLAEAESELVAGFHTEYSGLRWSFFFMAEYGSMLLVSALAVILFLGAWHGPIPIFSNGLGWTDAGGILGYLASLAGCANLILKSSLGVIVMIWVRWTLPRLRIDQVMTTCLKYCVPLASFCFLGALAWQAWIPWMTPASLPAPFGIDRAAVREAWVTDEPEATVSEVQTVPQTASPVPATLATQSVPNRNIPVAGQTAPIGREETP